jgi:uncharacterized MAPEG superfamily protein
MPQFAVPYGSALTACVLLGALYLMQALVADVVGIRAGHVPGMPITSGHDDLLFRTTRAQANTNENLPIFLLLSVAAMLLGASTAWTNRLVWTFVLARAAHMLAYYADLRLLRSTIFTVSTVALIGMLVVCIGALRG